MTVEEFKNEFLVTYDMASNGAPGLNNYEISLFLTQAIRDIVNEIYSNFEYKEFNKRALGPLISERELDLVTSLDYFDNLYTSEATLPPDTYFILQENVKLLGVSNLIEVISEDLDNLNKTLKNPFKKPTDRKIIRTQISKNTIRLYSNKKITNFKIKYIKKYSPIITSDFASDIELIGNETIDGKNTITNTELPDILHDKIVKRGVQLAIKSFRENNLKTQIEV